MTQRVAFVPKLRGSDGGNGDVFGGAVVGVYLISAGDPAQEHGCQPWRRSSQGAQRTLVLLARLSAAAELVECACFLDERIERRVFLRWFDEPEVLIAGPGA